MSDAADNGRLILSGTNTYTGGTSITEDQLEVSADANLGNASGGLTLSGGARMLAYGTFTSARTITIGAGGGAFSALGVTLTLTGAIGGSGSLSLISNAGTLVLSGTNTYTGGTIVNANFGGETVLLVGADANLGAASGGITLTAGALATTATFSSARSVTLNGAAQNGAELIPSAGTTLTLSGTLSGTGGLAFAGAGTVVLTGTASGATGTAVVTSGTLEVGSAASPSVTYGGSVTVQAAGTLAGHGTVSGNVTNGGTVSPGGTIGTLTVSGNYSQTDGDTLAIEANPTMASELVVSGSASLGGALALTFDAGTYTAGTEYTILTAAGGVTGTFGTLTESGTSTGLMPEALYQAGAVDLTLLNPPMIDSIWCETIQEREGEDVPCVYQSLPLLFWRPSRLRDVPRVRRDRRGPPGRKVQPVQRARLVRPVQRARLVRPVPPVRPLKLAR